MGNDPEKFQRAIFYYSSGVVSIPYLLKFIDYTEGFKAWKALSK